MPGQAKPGQAKLAKPSQAKPSRAEPSRVEPSQAKPECVAFPGCLSPGCLATPLLWGGPWAFSISQGGSILRPRCLVLGHGAMAFTLRVSNVLGFTSGPSSSYGLYLDPSGAADGAQTPEMTLQN